MKKATGTLAWLSAGLFAYWLVLVLLALVWSFVTTPAHAQTVPESVTNTATEPNDAIDIGINAPWGVTRDGRQARFLLNNDGSLAIGPIIIMLTATNTPAVTGTPTFTQTKTFSPTFTQTLSRTFTDSPTRTPSFTRTPTRSSTATRTESPTSTDTPTRTSTRTPSLTRTFSITRTTTLTRTASPTPTITLSKTISPTFTVSPTITQTFTPTPVLVNLLRYQFNNDLTDTGTCGCDAEVSGGAYPVYSGVPGCQGAAAFGVFLPGNTLKTGAGFQTFAAGATTFTMEATVYLLSATDANSVIMDIFPIDGGQWQVTVNETTALFEFFYYDGSNVYDLISSNPVPLNQCVLLQINCTPGGANIRIDGVIEDSDSNPRVVGSGFSDFFIGSTNTGAGVTQGWLDDFKFKAL